MPVTGLYFIPEINGTSANTTVSTLVDRLSKTHHPTFLNKWMFEHRLYREAPLPPPTSPSVSHHTPTLPPQHPHPPSPVKTLQILELSHHHPKLFTLAGSTIVTIDREFEALVRVKMGALWNIRQTLKGQGDCYDVDDFRVRVAQVTQGPDIKGVLVEVEYTPCLYLAQGEPIIRDFVEQLRIPQAREFFRPKGQDAATAVEDKVFTILDTGRQYMELLRMR